MSGLQKEIKVYGNLMIYGMFTLYAITIMFRPYEFKQIFSTTLGTISFLVSVLSYILALYIEKEWVDKYLKLDENKANRISLLTTFFIMISFFGFVLAPHY